MAGEFLVAAELNRRRILSAVTYGASKSADVWAFDDVTNRAVRVEVKTTSSNNLYWLVGEKAIVRGGWNPDLFWVLVLLPPPHPTTSQTDDSQRGKSSPRFYVFSSQKMGELMCQEYDRYHASYLKRHKKAFEGSGVWTLLVQDASPYENAWDTLTERVHRSS
jgi:hypothetical protein